MVYYYITRLLLNVGGNNSGSFLKNLQVFFGPKQSDNTMFLSEARPPDVPEIISHIETEYNSNLLLIYIVILAVH